MYSDRKSKVTKAASYCYDWQGKRACQQGQTEVEGLDKETRDGEINTGRKDTHFCPTLISITPDDMGKLRERERERGLMDWEGWVGWWGGGGGREGKGVLG